MGEVTVLLVHLKGLAVSESLPLEIKGKMKDAESFLSTVLSNT